MPSSAAPAHRHVYRRDRRTQAASALVVGAISTAHTLGAGSAAVLLIVVVALVLHSTPRSAHVAHTLPDGGVG